MYHHTAPVTAAAVGAGTLPFTGASLLWVVLASFAILAGGLAIRRIAPKRHTA